MADTKYITIMYIPDGAEDRRGVRIRQWLAKTIVVTFVVIVVGIIVFFAMYSSVLARAALAGKLQAENERLLRYKAKVQLLEENMMQMREVVTRLTQLAGIDQQFADFPDDSTILASFDNPRPAVVLRPGDKDLAIPIGLPVQGFVSQDFELHDQTRYHPGVDIVCPVGTAVLAPARGTVSWSGYDTTYGNMIVLTHSDSISTVYGHNDTLLVKVGQLVPAGGRLALSGNSGKSTAPHLHYEIRIHDKPINPLERWYDEEDNK